LIGIAHPLVSEILPVEPCQWELLLKELEMADDLEAVLAIKLRSERGMRLRAWIHSWAYRKFVPLRALEAAGLRVNVECRFPVE